MATYNHFYDLPVYKTCRMFRRKISLMVKEQFPKKEDFLLKTQLIRSSRSVSANIAEGFGRYHFQENIQFCRQSRGSLTETMEHIITAHDDGYISEEQLVSLNNDYKNCLIEINTYIKYLKSAKESKT